MSFSHYIVGMNSWTLKRPSVFNQGSKLKNITATQARQSI